MFALSLVSVAPFPRPVLTTSRWWALMLAATFAVALPSTQDAHALGANQQLSLKVLVMSATGSEPSLDAWTSALGREGIPYDTFVANTADALTAATLEPAADQGKYQAVVLATGDLAYCDASGCKSALDATEWGVLNAYQAKFGVRRVIAYAWPNPAYGLNYPFQSGDISGATGTLTAAGATAFPYLVGTVPYDSGTWGYYAEPLSATAGTVSPFTTLIAGPAGPGGTATALAGVFKRPDGIEELVVTASSNAYQSHHLLPIHGFISWATRGVQLGYYRHYFTIHIDDVFLPDDRWDIDDNVTYEDNGTTNPLIRMAPSDVDRAVQWQKKHSLQMDFVFNGGGSDEAAKGKKGGDPLTNKLLANKWQFYWINHTWSHPNLDTLSLAALHGEIKKNHLFAHKNCLPSNHSELVTGEHSGLANPNLPAALAANQIKWVAADNSKQPTPYKIGPAMTIPRHPSNLYYNVGTFAEQLDEYNYIYFENCTNSATTTCLTAPATWQQYVQSEANIMLRHVLTNDARPHYIHQANLAEDGTAYPVLDALLASFKQYVKAPIVQPYFRDSGALLQAHSAWAAAAAQATAYYKGGHVYLKSAVSVYAPVTGHWQGGLYGGQRSGWVWLPAGATKVLQVQNKF